MTEFKACKICNQEKDVKKDFYISAGRVRSDCKACTNKTNYNYQKKNKTWLSRCPDPETQKEHRKKYYEKNKAKFAEYRKAFRERHPDYFKDYFRAKKEKNGGSC